MGFRVVTIVLALFLLGIAAFNYERHGDLRPTALVVALAPQIAVFLVWYVIYELALPLWGFWSARRRGCYVHSCSIAIDEGGVRTWDVNNDYKKPWHSLDSVVPTRKHIFIYFNKCGAFIIPRRAFESIGASESFGRAAMNYLNAAKRAAASIDAV